MDYISPKWRAASELSAKEMEGNENWLVCCLNVRRHTHEPKKKKDRRQQDFERNEKQKTTVIFDQF